MRNTDFLNSRNVRSNVNVDTMNVGITSRVRAAAHLRAHDIAGMRADTYFNRNAYRSAVRAALVLRILPTALYISTSAFLAALLYDISLRFIAVGRRERVNGFVSIMRTIR